MGEAQEVVTTGVDALITLLQTKKLVSIEEAAKLIRAREAVLQTWVDFLIEEGIIGVEYKFITPYIYLRTDEKQVTILLDAKGEFYQKAGQRNIDPIRTHQLWQMYLSQNLPTIKVQFFKKMDDRQIPESKRDGLWAKYEQFLRSEVTAQ